ncbi:hypothetical protein GCM10023334_033710 [Nonomuraea thailandensis]
MVLRRDIPLRLTPRADFVLGKGRPYMRVELPEVGVDVDSDTRGHATEKTASTK